MFDFVNDLSADVRIAVECIPLASDAECPIRLVITGPGGDKLRELAFTPERATDTAASLARLFGQYMPGRDAWRIAGALRTAAIKVWAARN